jgi:hypothetical protein
MDTDQGTDQSADCGVESPDGRGRSPGSRRTQFRPGTSPNPGGVPRADQSAVPEPEEEAVDGAPAALKDLRWVRRNLGVRCRGTAIQEALRKEARKNPLKFNADYSRQERDFRATLEKAGANGAGGRLLGSEPADLPPDEGEERVLRMIDEILAEAGRRTTGN